MDGNKTEPVEEMTSEQKKDEVKREIISWIKVILIALALTFVIRKFIIVNAEVPTSSMENLIEPGDRLMGFRLSYAFSDPKRYDIVIFKYPVDESQKFIKRVIGLPGETVTINEGKIYVTETDGTELELEENYLPEEWTVNNNGFVYEIPEDSYLVLGDNRNVSLDARYWPEQAMIYGKATSEEDAWQYSFVSDEEILGKAIFKYWPSIQMLQ